MKQQNEKSGGRLKRLLLRSLAFIGVVYVTILGFLIASETTLVYPGSKYPRGNWEPDFAFEELNFQSADGTMINAWLLPQEEETKGDNEGKPPRYVLLCHGNGENVAQSAGYIGRGLQRALSANVLVFDYHGFGKVEGTPSEKVVKEDAKAALYALCKRFSIGTSDVILVGHSIGGGPAVYLAANEGCKALIVQRTFTSLPDVAQSIYWWLPVRYLMSNEFNSAETIKNYDGPFFQSHGEEDQLIPISFGKRLNDNCPSVQKEFMAIAKMGHLDGYPEAYWSRLADWVDEID